MTKRTKKYRARSRGLSPIEAILGVAVIFGAFVYPLSTVMRSVGNRLATDSERSNDAFLNQPR
jgi:hypothetical protein